jgi:hypothetical protein
LVIKRNIAWIEGQVVGRFFFLLVIDVIPLSISNRRDTEEIIDFVNQSFWLFLNFRDDRNKSSTLSGSIIFPTTEGSWLIMINV